MPPSIQIEVIDMSNLMEIDDDAATALLLAPSSSKSKKVPDSSDSSSVNILHQWTEDTFPVPEFPPEVLEMIKQGKILTRTTEFLALAGNHLMNVLSTSSPFPKNVYNTYMAALLKQNPDINDFNKVPAGFEIGVMKFVSDNFHVY